MTTEEATVVAAVEEATVVAAAEEAIVAAEAEEAIEDKDKSIHRLIGGSNKDEGSGNDFGSVSSVGFDEIPTTTPTGFRRDSDGGSGEGPARQWGSGWKIPVNSGFTNKN